MKSFACAIIFMAFSVFVRAEGIANLYEVDFVRVDSNGAGFVKFTSNLAGSPAGCTQPGYTGALAFNTNEAGGKAILSVVLTAKSSGKKIYAAGTGACAVYGVMEQWSWGYVQ